MENKTTVELLELLHKEEQKQTFDADKFSEILIELKSREPFFSIFNEDVDDSLPALRESIDSLEEEIKKLKRHKHDPLNGDVVVRI